MDVERLIQIRFQNENDTPWTSIHFWKTEFPLPKALSCGFRNSDKPPSILKKSKANGLAKARLQLALGFIVLGRL